MQFKRDTDYALRLLLCFAKQEDPETNMTISELSKNTFVPPTIASRLCRKLKDAKLLQSEKEPGGGVSYAMGRHILDRTLLDVVRAIEDENSLFAVFDKSTELYACCKDYFAETEQQFEDILKSITIRDLRKNQ